MNEDTSNEKQLLSPRAPSNKISVFSFQTADDGGSRRESGSCRSPRPSDAPSASANSNKDDVLSSCQAQVQSSSHGHEPPAEKGEYKQLIIFDFDQTLSTIHVFKFLAGWMIGPSSPPDAMSFATTSELGQLTRVVELDKEYPEGFGVYAMGGPERIKKLDELLTDLHKLQVELIVCSKGLIAPIRKILHDTNLLRHFTSIYAHSGDDYGPSTLEYDRKVKNEPRLLKEQAEEFMVDGAYAHLGGKEYLMKQLLKERRLPKEAGILVEDDKLEIEKCTKFSRTFFVDPPNGMSSAHMAQLRAMVVE